MQSERRLYKAIDHVAVDTPARVDAQNLSQPLARERPPGDEPVDVSLAEPAIGERP
jgi:hypothetical protein